MLKWSKYFQNPKHLKAYRMMTLSTDFLPIIAKWIGLKDNLTILDVGCGTGAFTYYLSKQTKDCEFYGIDIEDDFIQTARSNIPNNGKNKFSFEIANALELPFSDNFFDITVSYTFLTNMVRGKDAINEMKRVTKKHGTIVSVTAQSFAYQPIYDGIYPISDADYYYEYIALKKKIENAYEITQPIGEYTRYGTPPDKIPILFSECGLSNVCMHPIGWCFSLSDSYLSDSFKKEYIECFTSAEIEKIEAYIYITKFREMISLEEKQRYIELLNIRKNRLLKNISDNSIWEWCGGAQILMTGIV